MTFRGRKSLKRRRGRNRTLKRGGKFIGKGAYGCLFRPALLCKGDAARRPDHVSKLMHTQEAELEYLVHSQALSTSLAENYVGLPLDFGQ